MIILNRGRFTITRIEAQFSPDGMHLIPHHAYERSPSWENLGGVWSGWGPSEGRALYGVLTPFDRGTRFETDTVHVKFLKGWYPVVRWTDRWGTRWKHRRGEVRQVRYDQPWTP